jgi:hypothetical protein
MRTFELAILGFAIVIPHGIARTGGARFTSIYSSSLVIEENGSLYSVITAPGAAIF